MIHSVEDLKRRELLESNVLKSFILIENRGFLKPSLDDMLIHDYQMSNSVTINSILSNYIVNLRYAFDILEGSDEASQKDRYFAIVEQLEKYNTDDLDD